MSEITSRRNWFENCVKPVINKIRPDFHVTYDMYGNKSRATGFDYRTWNPVLREKAGVLHAAETAARRSEGSDEYDALNEQVARLFVDFVTTKGAIPPHKTTKTAKFKKSMKEACLKFLPSMSDADQQLWSTHGVGEHAVVCQLIDEFRTACVESHQLDDAAPLLAWEKRRNDFYRK